MVQELQPSTIHNLPPQTSSFVGRIEEIVQINDLLCHKDCRLLTLLGAGGIGKTRLAIALAEQQASNFSNGIYFIPLQAIQSPDNVLSTIAAVLEIKFREGPVKEQLLYFLHDKRLLLVIDNFEHLLEAADLLQEIIEAAPEVKLLLTSREALNLQSEWLYHVIGMHFPQEGDPIEDFSAVKLFAERARQVRRSFSLSDERDSVARICRLVEGMPLALELAAAWLKRLTCADIADEIGGNLDFLASNLRGVPDRHRSIRAVFAHSWGLLSAEEQSVFMKLSVFRGGFTREAAEAITGATLFMLSDLVDKSLLRLNPEGRYDIHELLRQYAQEKLDERPDIRESILDKYSQYYLNLIAIQDSISSYGRQLSQQMIETLKLESEHVLQAWQYGLDKGWLTEIQKALAPLSYYIFMHDISHMIRQTIDLLQTNSQQYEQAVALGFMLAVYGQDLRMKGNYAQASEYFYKGVNILRSLEANQALVWALSWLGTMLYMLCNFAEAREIAQETFELAEKLKDYSSMANSMAILSTTERMSGHYYAAEQHLKRGSEFLKQDGNQSFYIHNRSCIAEIIQLRGEFKQAQEILKKTLALILEAELRWHIAQQYEFAGHIEHALGNYELAEANLLNSLHYAREVSDPRRIIFTQVALADLYLGMSKFDGAQQHYQEAISRAKPTSQRWQEAWAWRGLAQVAYSRGDFQEAIRHSEESLKLCHEIGWKYGKVQNYNLRGLVAVAEHHVPEARRYFYQALNSDLVNETPPLILATLYGMSHFAASAGDLEQAVELVSLILAHPKSHADTKQLAQTLLDELEAELDVDLFEAAIQRGQNSDLEQVVETLIHELAAQIGQIPSGAMAALDEPLTKTELEILRLMDSQLSYPEIAEQRNVSLNTIKTHRSNIYSKLAASSREEALQKARDLALI